MDNSDRELLIRELRIVNESLNLALEKILKLLASEIDKKTKFINFNLVNELKDIKDILRINL